MMLMKVVSALYLVFIFGRDSMYLNWCSGFFLMPLNSVSEKAVRYDKIKL